MDKFIQSIYQLLDYENYDQARKQVRKQLEKEDLDHNLNLISKLKLYGLLTDIGSESMNKNDLEESINFYIKNEEKIKKIITVSSYYYNLANGKQGLCKIFYLKNPGVHSISKCREKFQEPIDLYWLAYKNTSEDDNLLDQILINLSISLMKNSRIVEALQMLDIVLKKNPNFPNALVTRAENLNYLDLYTNSKVSVALHTQIYCSYKQCIENNSVPPNILVKCQIGLKNAQDKMISYGQTVEDIDKEINISKMEYEFHSNYRKFCIDNFLTLNEHSLYCNCLLTAKDQLQIGISNVVFKSELLPRLEILLNRMKSEYAFARWNYYKSSTEDAFDYDVIFSELFEDEIIDSQSETLRASFRICYGILDKIALGICKLYGVDGGNMYFERFWEDKNRKDVLEKQRNIHLNALASIACDLNSSRGELKHFKKWRNKIEHNLLILQDQKSPINDSFNVLEDKDFITAVDIKDFRDKTIHLLQITRAAILSFVYCVRLETITKNDPNTTPSIIIGPKQ